MKRFYLVQSAFALMLIGARVEAVAPTLRVRLPIQANPSRPSPAASDPRDVVTRARLNLAALPEVDLPPPLSKPPKEPGPVTLEFSPDFSVVPRSNWENAKRVGGAVAFRLEAADEGAFGDVAVGVDKGALRPAGTQAWVSCGPHAPSVPVRWTRFRLEPDGSATLKISDGFTHPKACLVTKERETTVRLAKVLATPQGVVMFAARTQDGMLVVMPAAQRVIADSSAGTVSVHQGAWTRVFVPFVRGGSGVVHAQFDASSLAKFAVQTSLPKPANEGFASLRIELTQAAREAQPTVLVRAAFAHSQVAF